VSFLVNILCEKNGLIT